MEAYYIGIEFDGMSGESVSPKYAQICSIIYSVGDLMVT
jgi:hypothetical protein